ncbi:MAG: hypothetical protein AAGC92_13745 [Pseudomonadota bacterium]
MPRPDRIPHRAFFALVSMLLAGLPAGPLAAQAAPETRAPLAFSLDGGALYQFDAGLDDGGEFSVARGYVEPGLTYSFGPAGSLGLRIGLGHAAYDFSPDAFVGGLEPWGGVRDFRISLPVRWAAADRLQVFAIPSVRFDWETGADMTDGMTAGAILGAAWRVNDRLSIGPGAGVFSGIEEDVSVFPVLFLDWEITDGLSLRTASGLGASRGPGLVLDWQVSSNWSLGLGARYEVIRFRLDDTGPAPDGVGEDRAIPIFLTATYSLTTDAQLTALAGFEAFGQLSLEDAAGTTVREIEYDPTPFLGFAFSMRF